MPQFSDAQLTTEAQVIRDETTPLANTKTRVYDILKNIIDSKGNNTELALKQALVNSAVALTDGATIDLTATKHTLASSAATRTFTISYTGDDIVMVVTLSATSAVYTFPATALCVSDGVASGDNTCTIEGISGDKHIFAIKKIGSNYYVVAKNFLQ
jgi:hypothetical protein